MVVPQLPCLDSSTQATEESKHPIHPSPRTGASLTSMNSSHTSIIPSHFMMVAQPLISGWTAYPRRRGMCMYNTPETTLFRSTMVADIPPKAGIIPPPAPPPHSLRHHPLVNYKMYMPKVKRERRDVSLTRPTCVMSCHAHRVFPLLASFRPPPPLSSSRQAAAVCRVHVMVPLYAVCPSPGQEKAKEETPDHCPWMVFCISHAPIVSISPPPGTAPHLCH